MSERERQFFALLARLPLEDLLHLRARMYSMRVMLGKRRLAPRVWSLAWELPRVIGVAA